MGRRSRKRLQEIQGQKPPHTVMDETFKPVREIVRPILGHDPANLTATPEVFQFTPESLMQAASGMVRRESRYNPLDTGTGISRMEATRPSPEVVEEMMRRVNDRQQAWGVEDYQGLASGVTGSAYGLANRPSQHQHVQNNMVSAEELARQRQTARDLFGRYPGDEAEERRRRRQRKARASATYLEGVHDRLASKGKPAPQELIDAIEMMSQIAEGKLAD